MNKTNIRYLYHYVRYSYLKFQLKAERIKDQIEQTNIPKDNIDAIEKHTAAYIADT